MSQENCQCHQQKSYQFTFGPNDYFSLDLVAFFGPFLLYIGFFFAFALFWPPLPPGIVREEVGGMIVFVFYCSYGDITSAAAVFFTLIIERIQRRYYEHQGATASWARRFDNPCDVIFPSNVHQNWRDNKVALYFAEIDNRANPPLLQGIIYAKQYYPHFEPFENTDVTVFYKCGYDLEFGREIPIQARHDRCSRSETNEGFCIYRFDGTVPINSNRNSRLQFYIRYEIKGPYHHTTSYIDNNFGNFYVFTSNSNLGRASLIFYDIRAFLAYVFISPFQFCWYNVTSRLRRAILEH